MPAPATIIDLVTRFRANLDSYKRGLYNETIDFTSPADVARHDGMVALVERTAEGVDLHQKLASEGAPHVKTVLQRHAKGGSHGSGRSRLTGWCTSCTG